MNGTSIQIVKNILHYEGRDPGQAHLFRMELIERTTQRAAETGLKWTARKVNNEIDKVLNFFRLFGDLK